MDRAIEIVPALKRLELQHVGCWENLKLEFIPGLNIITEDGSAWGKTTIFRAILQSLIPSSQLTYPLSPTMGFEHGAISVEFMSATHNIELLSHDATPKPHEAYESVGQTMLRQLKAHLKVAMPNIALLIEDEVTAALSLHNYEEVVELLNSSQCQVIIQIVHRLDLRKFPKARIYACHIQEQNKVGMKLIQMGGYNV